MSRTTRNSTGIFKLPIGPGDVRVQFPAGRNPKLPDIYKAAAHVLSTEYKNIYYFIHDGTMEAAKATYELEVNELKIPQGSHEEAVELGMYEYMRDYPLFSFLSLFLFFVRCLFLDFILRFLSELLC